MKKYIILIFLFSAGVFGGVKFGGSFENQLFLSAGKYTDAQVMDTSSLKLQLQYVDENFRIFSDTWVNLLYGKNALSLMNIPEGAPYIYTGTKDNSLVTMLYISRLYIKLKAPLGNITIGREYLNFGQNHLFNALEWNKSFIITDPLATKPAVNMISYNLGINDYSKAKFFVGANDKWNDVLAGGELLFGIKRLEFGFDYQYKGSNQNIVGLFFQADIGITLFGSYACHLNNVIEKKERFSVSHESSLGGDYSFAIGTSKLVVQQIFYINSLGAKNDKSLITTPSGDYYLRAFAYSYTSLMFTINEFYSAGVDNLISIIDGSGAVLPKFSMSVYNNVMLDMLLGIYYGKKGSEFGPQDKQMILPFVYSPAKPNVGVSVKLTASF